MENNIQNKLIEQIGRLCEKQFRKGFQQGYFAKKDHGMSEEEVFGFRFKGMDEGYRNVVDPVTGQEWTSQKRLDSEMWMEDMHELRLFMEKVDFFIPNQESLYNTGRFSTVPK